MYSVKNRFSAGETKTCGIFLNILLTTQNEGIPFEKQTALVSHKGLPVTLKGRTMAQWKASLREHAHLRRWLCTLNILLLTLLITAALLVYTGYLSPLG
ncbi:hypothetical protein DTC83_25925 [Salmonella enterica]|nr:hypothetical protein [Salmonella enterica]